MRTFTDHKQRPWTLDLNLQVAYAFEQCQSETMEILEKSPTDFTGVKPSLLEIEETKFLEMITLTPIMLKLSWLCVLHNPDLNPQATSITEAEYLAGFKGDTVHEVKLLMLEELADFFPQMGTLFSKLRQVQVSLMSDVKAALEEVSPQLDKSIAEFLHKQSKELRRHTGLGQKSG